MDKIFCYIRNEMSGKDGGAGRGIRYIRREKETQPTKLNPRRTKIASSSKNCLTSWLAEDKQLWLRLQCYLCQTLPSFMKSLSFCLQATVAK